MAAPVLRPYAAGPPGLDIARRARLGHDGTGLVLTTRSGRRRRYPVGDGGITGAVFLDAQAAPAWGHGGPPVAGSWGRVQLQDADGRLVREIPVGDWLPESPALFDRHAGGTALLTRTGLDALLTSCGVPLRTVTDPEDALLDRTSRRRGRQLRPGHALPDWYLYTRRLALPLWTLSMVAVILTDSSPPWLAVLMAAAGCVWTLNHAALRPWSRWVERRSRPEVLARYAPAPGADAGATPRFLTTAAVRVQKDDIVLVDSAGRERWLPLAGPHAVTGFVRVRRTGQREPLGVELRGRDGAVRGALPWGAWFAGAAGADRWRDLGRTSGLPVRESELGRNALWPTDPLATADTVTMAPLPPGAARRSARIPEGPLPVATTGALCVIGPLLALAYGSGLLRDGGSAAGWATVVLGGLMALTAGLSRLIPYLDSRLRLDRRAAEGTEAPA
ncbi:hypothetical protein O7599_23720 [Streptomyces sp. WMMC500]|uniref:hypothetical protein n=1 Tax=Streptomyces sp. WMMC500 TaxID=3015154 RepID=UPI00248B6A4B|nr:hypothetical protein [Streptomyces sp. WMMC500]WBB58622.1 hypothetical protein O7599_23720 [Streptomyces sp. WMMC500]